MNHSTLIHMANQIARNFAVQGEKLAAESTAEHIRLYWDPRMKAAIADLEHSNLDSIVAHAFVLLRLEREGDVAAQ